MSSHSKSLYSTWVALFLSLGSIACAYYVVIPASTIAQPSFIKYMHLDTASNATQLIGAINGVFIAGAFIGSLLSSQATDVLGRRASLSLAAALATFGGALQSGSVNIAMFIAARLVAGLGIGAMFPLIPLFQSEIAPPKARGLIVGLHGIMISLGTILPNWIGFGFYFVHANGAEWRVPLAIQIVFPLVLAAGIWFVPESPRWLINKDRHDDALRSLIRYHRNKSDPDDTFARNEYLQIRAQHDEDEKGQVTWVQIFTIPTYRRRAVVAAFVMIGSQMTATLLVSVYNPILYGSLGYDVPMQLIFTGIWSNFTIIGNTICAFTVDRMGRVLALKIGWTGNLLALIGIVVSLAMFENSGSRSAAIAGIFFLYIQILTYGTFVDATTYIYTTEIFPNNMRGKGMSIAIGCYFLVLLVQLTTAPTAFANIGWRILLIYLCCLAAFIPFIWILCPETKGRSLEEIGLIFGDRHVTVGLDSLGDANEEVQLSDKHTQAMVNRVDHEHVEG